MEGMSFLGEEDLTPGFETANIFRPYWSWGPQFGLALADHPWGPSRSCRRVAMDGARWSRWPHSCAGQYRLFSAVPSALGLL